MPSVQRYSNTIRGVIMFTGNTLGFAGPGVIDVGAFLATNPAYSVAGYPTPSTSNWTQNNSTAQLTIPAGSTVVYAELVWGGSEVGTATPALNINTNITFTTPLTTQSIALDPLTAQSDSAFGQTFYTRSANVTALVAAAGSGTYAAGGVSAAIEPGTPAQTGTAGWTLAVVIQNPILPYQSITYYVSSLAIFTGVITTTFTGFLTPNVGTFNSRVLISGMEGNPSIVGDYAQLGQTVGTLSNLSGPNNLTNNFFASQINNGNPLSGTVGQLDTTGSFGTLNQTPGSYVPYVRNGWDITNVPGTALPNNISQAVLGFGSNGDAYAVSTFAFSTDVNSANLAPIIKVVDKTDVLIGETLTYSFTLTNNGNSTALNVTLIDTIPNGTTFINNSLTVNGVPQIGANPNPPGAVLGNISTGGSFTVTFKVLVNTLPSPNPVPNKAGVFYQFTNLTTIPTYDESNTVNTLVRIPLIPNLSGTVKLVNKTYADCGDTIKYTIVIPNTGNTTAQNVILNDTVPSGTVFVPGSLLVNNVVIAATPASIPIGSIGIGTITTVTFNVVVQC